MHILELAYWLWQWWPVGSVGYSTSQATEKRGGKEILRRECAYKQDSVAVFPTFMCE